MKGAVIYSTAIEHDTDEVRRLRAANNPDAGVLTCAAPPDMRRSYELSWELLDALGKLRGVTGAGRAEDLNWEVLGAWLPAHDIEHVVVADAERLTGAFLRELVGLALVTEVKLWLVAYHPVDDAYSEALTDWPVVTASSEELEAVVRRGEQRPKVVGAGRFPAVPVAESFLTFRMAAKHVLEPADFEVVEQLFRRTYLESSGWCRSALQTGGLPVEDAVLGHLRTMLRGCATVDEMVVVIRAVQVAAFRCGWLVSVDLPRLLVTAEQAEASAVTSPETWRRLRAYREPYRGAACALSAAGLALDQLAAIRMADVAPNGDLVHVARGSERTPLAVPSHSTVYLRAQLAHRRIQGAGPEELLFATEDEPMAQRYLANAVRAPVTEVGVPLYSQQVERATLDPRRWAQRWGISVQGLS